MPRKMPLTPDRLRVASKGRPIGVDRKLRVIRGYVVAQLGPFKSQGRGEFDEASLDTIVELYQDHANGLKARFAHPSESNDGLGKFLGRSKNAWKGTAKNADGEEVPAVRADLHLDASAFRVDGPNGNLGDYILSLAESDPDALSSSLVLKTERQHRLNEDGTPMLGEDGKPLPPLWRPKKLFASDIVDEGDAVDGLLSASPKWTNEFLSQGEALLNKLFAGQDRRVVQSRCTAFLGRYLEHRFGETKMPKNGCGCGGGGQKLGANLGGVLTDLIEGKVSDEMTRDTIIGNMADAAGISTDEVEQIVSGEGDCPTMDTLTAFANTLECSVGELVMAAEADGCDYAGTTNDEGDQGEGGDGGDGQDGATPEEQRSGASVDILRRRLALKSKI